MAEKPILFNTDMVKAILEGRKTQTRRIIKPQPKENHIYKLGYVICSGDKSEVGKFAWGTNEHGGIISKARPPYQIGDTLWVRETWCYEENMHDITEGKPDLPSGRYKHRYIYKASYPDYAVDVGVGTNGWRPSIHMPREAARLFLKVTDVRVERLQDITDEGAKLEGSNFGIGWEEKMKESAIDRFRRLWDGIYHNWNENPWVWVIEFERVR